MTVAQAATLGRSVTDALGRGTVHPFPARMSPDIVLDALPDGEPLRILDPMAGSGTVLALAQSKGHAVTGLDLDPLAALISRVWTTPLDRGVFMDHAVAVLTDARVLCGSLAEWNAYPLNSDDETERFARFWFDGGARRQLAALAYEIAERGCSDTVRDALWCAFSNLIIAKQSGASLALDLAHSRPHRAFERAPAEPFPNFMGAAVRVANGCLDADCEFEAPDVREGDARRIPLDDGSVDMVVTSPPYLNAIDYLRCSKFSLVWMGHTVGALRRIRAASVGTEVGMETYGEAARTMSAAVSGPGLKPRQEAMLARYVHDMRDALRETARVLDSGGRAVYVVGDNMVRGSLVRNDVILRKVADAAGLLLVSGSSRELPAGRRSLPPPDGSARLGGRIRRETVLVWERP